MNLKIYFLSISFFTRFIKCDDLLIQFIRDYFKNYYIHQLAIFACWSAPDAIDFIKKTTQLDTVVSYNTIQKNIDIISILRVNYYHLGVILDHDCPESDSILNQFSHQLRFNDSYYWLLLTNASSLPMDSLSNLPLTVETEMTVAIRKISIFELYDIYNPSYRHGGSINITYKGQWTSEHGLHNELTQYKYIRRQNLFNMQLNLSIVLLRKPRPDLETYLTQPVYTELDTMGRFQHAMNLLLKDYYGFSINVKLFNSWGIFVNGSWDGIIGDMVKGMTDLSSTPFYLKPERIPVCEYTVNLWNVHTAFTFRHPRKNDLENGFLKPFSEITWLVTLAVGITYWICLFFTVKMEVYFNKFEKPDNSLMSIPASESGLITISAISQQGASSEPRVFSGRIIFISLFIWALLLYQYYSADIVSSLLAKPPRWITTAKSLRDSDLKCGLEDVSYNHYFHKQTINPYGREIYWKKVAPRKDMPKGSFFSIDEGFKKVREGGFAFYCDLALGYKIIEDTFTEGEICELQHVRIVKPYVRTWAIVAKHSPFKKMVTYGYRKIIEHGLPKRLLPIWHHRRPKCPESYSAKPSPMTLKEFCPALFLLLIGVGSSLIILALEYFFKALDNTARIKNDFQKMIPTDSEENICHEKISYSSNI